MNLSLTLLLPSYLESFGMASKPKINSYAYTTISGSGADPALVFAVVKMFKRESVKEQQQKQMSFFPSQMHA